MPTAVANSVSVDYRSLDTPLAWGDAQNWALGFGYRSTVEVYTDESGNPVWHIELNGPGNLLPVSAGLTDVLVWDEVSMNALTQDAFAARYTPS